MTISTDTQITELTVDDHACLTFGEAEELFDLTAAFVRDGLDGGLKVMWLSETRRTGARGTSCPGAGSRWQSAMAAGQMAAAGLRGPPAGRAGLQRRTRRSAG